MESWTFVRQQASLRHDQASNKVTMKTVSQRVIKEIEYLRALAEVYEHDNNRTALEATQAAIAALHRLVEIIHNPKDDSPDTLPVAA
jgi:hypothetical protein